MKKTGVSYSYGCIGEKLALEFLTNKGYVFIAQRFKTPYGEIDLIMRNETILVFIEVKKRTFLKEALFSLSSRQIERIINTSLIFLQKNPDFQMMSFRFDLVGISQIGKIHHIQNITLS